MVIRWPSTGRFLCSNPGSDVKFGKLVTYADDPYSHAKTEFAFDVFQAAKGRYASAAYKSFIGFEVAKPSARSGVPGHLWPAAGEGVPEGVASPSDRIAVRSGRFFRQ